MSCYIELLLCALDGLPCVCVALQHSKARLRLLGPAHHALRRRLVAHFVSTSSHDAILTGRTGTLLLLWSAAASHPAPRVFSQRVGWGVGGVGLLVLGWLEALFRRMAEPRAAASILRSRHHPIIITPIVPTSIDAKGAPSGPGTFCPSHALDHRRLWYAMGRAPRGPAGFQRCLCRSSPQH